MNNLDWTIHFGNLMLECLVFLNHKWTVYGYQISIVNCIVLCEAFDLLMTKIGRMFGKEEVEE